MREVDRGAHVRVLDCHGEAHGAGVLVSPRHIAVCYHVAELAACDDKGTTRGVLFPRRSNVGVSKANLLHCAP